MMQLFRSDPGKKIIREILFQEKTPPFVRPHLARGCAGDAGLFADTASIRKSFPGTGCKQPSEIVSAVDKAAVRAKILHGIRENLAGIGLPYIRLSYYPAGYRTVCAFRVDCDDADAGSFRHLLSIAAKYNLPLSWYAHVSAQESYLDELAAVRSLGHDVQLHCYVHETFGTCGENMENFGKGRDLMVAAGIPVTGFVSPFGKWNPSLDKVLEQLGFSYSSEFALAYDDLPFHPIYDNHRSRVLQVPIHPVCIGSLRKAGFTPDEMKAYFDGIIRYKYDRGLPVLLYGHPRYEIDGYPEVAGHLFSAMSALKDAWVTTFTGFAAWWQYRLGVKYEAMVKKDRLIIRTGNTDPSLQVHLERSDGKEAQLPLLASSRKLSELEWKDKMSGAGADLTV